MTNALELSFFLKYRKEKSKLFLTNCYRSAEFSLFHKPDTRESSCKINVNHSPTLKV